MAGATLTTIDNILKEVYDDKITDQIVGSHVLLTRWKSKVSDVVIKGHSFRMTMPLRTGRNQGLGARAEDTALPAPKNVTYDVTQPALCNLYGSIRLTGQAVDVSSGSAAETFANSLNEEINAMTEEQMLELGRYIMGDGTGALAQANGAGSSATALIVDNPDTRWLAVGMTIDVWTSKTAGSQEVDSIEITAINRGTSTVTLASAQTWSDNSYVFREDNHAVSQPAGLLNIVDDGATYATFQSITRTSAGKDFWKANLVSNGAAAYSESFLQSGIDEAEINGSDARISIGVCDHTSRRYLFKVLSAQKRFVNVQALKGGFSALSYEGGSDPVPFVADRLCWPGYTYLLDERAFMFGWAPKPGGQWMQHDGSVLKLDQSNGRKEAWIAYRYMRFQLAVRICRNNVRLYNYTAP